MSTNFPNVNNGDIIDESHVDRYTLPVQNLESGTAWYRDDIGGTDAYKVSFAGTLNPVTAYTPGLLVIIKAASANTGAATLEIAGPGGDISPAVALRKKGNVALAAGDISVGQIIAAVYTDTDASGGPRFEVIGGIGSGGGAGATDLNGLDDVAIAGPTSGQVVRYNGTEFVNAAVGIADVTNLQTTLDAKQDESEKGSVNGYAGLDATGKVPLSQLPAPSGSGVAALDDLNDVAVTSPASGEVIRHNGTEFVNASVGIADVTNLQTTLDGKQDDLTGISDVPGLQTALDARQEESEKGQANGYAGLDSGGKVPTSQLPTLAGANDLDDLDDVAITTPASGQVLRYSGTGFVNASVGIVDVTNLQTTLDAKQDDLTGISDVPGLQIALDARQEESEKGQANGYASLDATGKVPASQLPASAGSGVSDLDDLDDVVITSPAAGQTIRHNGTAFVNAAMGFADITGLQGELDSKQDILTGTTDVPGLDTALSGKASTSHTHSAAAITSGTLAVAQGGTGAANAAGARTNLGAQAQDSALDEIAALTMAKGDILVHNGTAVSTLTPGSNGQLLSADSSQTNGLSWVSGSSGGTPTGTANKVAYFNNSGALASTANFSYLAATTRMGVGPTAPTSTLHVSSAATGAVDKTTGIMVSRGGQNVGLEAGLSNDSYVGTTDGFTTSSFSLRTANAPRFTLDPSGKCTLFPEIIGGQKLKLSGYPSGAVNGNRGLELNSNAGTVVRMEVGDSTDSYVGTTTGWQSSSFSLRTANLARFTIDYNGKCTLLPEIIGGQKLKLSGYPGGAVNGNRGLELNSNAGTVVKMEVGDSTDSYVGTTTGWTSSSFSLRTANLARLTIDYNGKCTLFPEIIGGQKVKLSGYTGAVNGSKGLEIFNGNGTVRMEAGSANDSYVGTATGHDFHLRRGNVDVVSLRNGYLELNDNNKIRFKETIANGTSYVELKGPASLAGNVTVTLPATAGTANQVLKTDGSGNLSWGDPHVTGSGTADRLAFWSSSTGLTSTSGFSRSGSELVAPTLTTSLGQVFSNDTFVSLFGRVSGSLSLRANFQSSKTYIPGIRNLGAGQLMYWNTDGELVFQYSRGAHKEDVKPVELSIDDLMKWRPVEFKWKEKFGGNQDVGLIAEEVASVYPLATTSDQPWDYIDEKTGEYAVDERGLPKRLQGDAVVAGVKYEKAWIPMLAAVQDFYKRYQDDQAKLERRLAAIEKAR